MKSKRWIEISSYNEGRGIVTGDEEEGETLAGEEEEGWENLAGEEGEGELGWILLFDWVVIDCGLVEGGSHGFMDAGVIGETRLDVCVSIERGRMEGNILIVSGERKSVIKSMKEGAEE